VYFNGFIDEVRISSVGRDACWIGTGYSNQSNPAAHVTVASTGETQTPAFLYRREITIKDLMTPAACAGDLSDFPILVSLSGSWLRLTGRTIRPTAESRTPADDIVFRGSDGVTPLDHEVEAYDGSAAGGSWSPGCAYRVSPRR
jgi:hypothetical protein